jgi:acetyl-CoA C-acetyltransferase
MSKNIYIVATGRTPIGSMGGVLSSFTAPQLGAIAIKHLLEITKIDVDKIDEVLMGCVLTAGIGQAPARQASLLAGLSKHTDCTTINKVCASGTKAIMLAAQAIACGNADIVIAGGMESMSNVPYYLDKARNGYKLGHGQLMDGIIKDGLWDVYHNYHMGSAGENTAMKMGIDRVAQDNYAIESYKRAQKAYDMGAFASEIIPVEVIQKGKDSEWIKEDEEYKKVKFDKISALRPAFDPNGTITAANASKLNDGAAAVMLASERAIAQYQLKPIARIVSWADAAQEPEWFTTAPSKAIPKAMAIANLSIEAIDAFEINEAFSVVSIANNQILGLDPNKVNIWGGAVALGHPIGCSGARIVVTLLNILQSNRGRWGVAGICNGGGGASALVVEKLA